MIKKLPRVLIAGTSSGCGKTTATVAVLSLIKRKGIRVSSFKCGPDYIDPMFHETVLGIPSTNLDPFFSDENQIKSLLAETGGSLSVIEGVMGYYDGTGENGCDNSTYTVAKMTNTPVILIVIAKGASTSVLATIDGFLNFLPDSRIAGVILNQATPMTYKMLCRQIAARFGEKVKPLGFIPKLPEDCVLGSRHLGLITAGEISDKHEKLDKIADLCLDTLDTDGMISLAQTSGDFDCSPPEIPVMKKIRIAIARDDAFCFYYKDTVRLFEKMGAEITYFSPLLNEPVPAGSDGLILGGGYPELYADSLEKNETSKRSVRAAIESGMPTIAECGGFQYLGTSLDGKEMCAVLGHESTNTGKLVRFGYVNLTSKKPGLFGEAGMKLKAHEFHYYDSTVTGDSFTAEKPSGRKWDCAVYTDTLYAGYPHLYLYSAISASESFYRKCLEYKEKKS